MPSSFVSWNDRGINLVNHSPLPPGYLIHESSNTVFSVPPAEGFVEMRFLGARSVENLGAALKFDALAWAPRQLRKLRVACL